MCPRDESQVIQKIVDAALTKLNHTPLHVAKYPTGIEGCLHELSTLIDLGKNDVRIIGIYGIGGIGKTTIAKAVFNKFTNEFEGSCFLADVRDMSKQQFGLVQLQEMLLFDILENRNLKVGNTHRGVNIIRERLCHKRVLLVLDDVDELGQLETLAGGHEWFGLGSRIIITARNKHLLTTHGANGIYEVQGLDHQRALELLSWNAFKRKQPVDDYFVLSHRVVNYASGHPLTLEVLGSFLCGRTEHEWKSTIQNLEKKPHKKVYEILKISYDALQADEKSIFLDVACFFVGHDKDFVIQVLGSSDFCPIIGMGVLTDMSLIKIEFNKLRMHPLIQEVGKEIVRQESLEAGKHSRLWSLDDVIHVFSEKKGTNSIEGIMLKYPEQRTLHLNAKAFKGMKRLRLLALSNIVLSSTIEYAPNELRFVDLPGYSFPTFSFNSGPKKLVILRMPCSHIHELGKHFKNFENLKVVNLSHSKSLSKIPDLSTAPNLESLILDYCTSLVEIHESVGYLSRMVCLELQFCSKLRNFPRNLVSKSFRILNFHGCSRLKNFPNIVGEMKCLTSLSISCTSIEELPSSIELLVSLKELFLIFCKNLVHIPTSIYKLSKLEVLSFCHCSKLYKFPKNVLNLKPDELFHSPKFIPKVQTSNLFVLPMLKALNLQSCNLCEADFLTIPESFPILNWLNLSKNKFVNLPSLCKLSNLSDLDLSNCELLREIPELPKSIMRVNASDCKSLVDTHGRIMDTIISNNMGFLKDFEFEIVIPGGDIPDWFSHKCEGNSISFIMPSNVSKNLAGVIICAVFEAASERVKLSFDQEIDKSHTCSVYTRVVFSMKSGNMHLFYLPAASLISPFNTPVKDFSIYRISFSGLVKSKKVVSRCGTLVLWDQEDDILNDRNSHSSHDLDKFHHNISPSKRSFDGYLYGDRHDFSSQQKRHCEPCRIKIPNTESMQEKIATSNQRLFLEKRWTSIKRQRKKKVDSPDPRRKRFCWKVFEFSQMKSKYC
ncbi:disease resistance protein RPV1 [Ziziphus jujuba]|uniref:ADP-ribosyl cyclase/cyclic ADP-ribose hydrolase n=1 Tax=Ziziphus jujuba TaxID=326968 RepID=A0ABM4A310_ZIZJJ|nr:disease resistance protein RPV1 [Ziziphus jujuba]